MDSYTEGKDKKEAEHNRSEREERSYVPGVMTSALRPDVTATTISCKDFFVVQFPPFGTAMLETLQEYFKFIEIWDKLVIQILGHVQVVG